LIDLIARFARSIEAASRGAKTFANAGFALES